MSSDMGAAENDFESDMGDSKLLQIGFLWEKEMRMLFLYVSSSGCRLSPTINNCISGNQDTDYSPIISDW